MKRTTEIYLACPVCKAACTKSNGVVYDAIGGRHHHQPPKAARRRPVRLALNDGERHAVLHVLQRTLTGDVLELSDKERASLAKVVEYLCRDHGNAD